MVTTGADVDTRYYSRQPDCVVHCPAIDAIDIFQPVSCRDSRETRHVLRYNSAGDFNDLQGQSDAVLETAAILVRTFISRRRDE